MSSNHQRLSKSNQSIEKAMNLIEVLARSVKPMKLTEIAEATGMPASTVLRLVGTLEDIGYVCREPTSKGYYLSIKFAYLGNRAREHNSILSCVHPVLSRLSADCGECACLGVEQNGSVVYLDVVRQEDATDRVVARYIGNWAPMYCTGIGKVLLSSYDRNALQGYMDYTQMIRYTPKTIVDPAALRKELELDYSRGSAIDDEESEPSTLCIAAPITNFANHVVAALSITGPTERMTPDRLGKLIPKVLDAASQASARMGFVK